jgi:hypothetical protein
MEDDSPIEYESEVEDDVGITVDPSKETLLLMRLPPPFLH